MVTFILVTAVILTAGCVLVWGLVLALVAAAAVRGLWMVWDKCAGR
jgi:hypothetical protein